MKPYYACALSLAIPFHFAYADEQNTATPETIIPTSIIENLFPSTPYNINNLIREQGIKHDLKYDGCNGFVRAAYLQTHAKKISKEQAYGLGGELGCGVSWRSFFKFHTSAFAAINPGFNSGNNDEIHGDFFDAYKNSYITLGEAVMTLSFANIEAHIGPQRINTPHMDQDDLRLLPNIFEAYLLDYHVTDTFYLGSGFVRTAKGWENNGNASDFVGIGEAFGGGGSQAWLAWGRYQQGNINASAWYYSIKDVQQIFFADMVYQDHVDGFFAYELGVQFDLGRSIGQESLGLVDANTLGAFASISAYGLSFTTAYNKNFGQSAAVNSVGGGPFFTSMEDLTLDAVDTGKNAQALLFNLEYQPYFLEAMTLGVAAGDFQAENVADFHTQEVDAYLRYQYQQMFSVDFMYAFMTDKQSSIDTEQFRVILAYQF